MKQIVFDVEDYIYDGVKYNYVKTDASQVGQFELLWAGVNNVQIDLTKKEHKIIKRLKVKLREISIYKDNDKDSRILKLSTQQLILETDEYDIMKKLLESNRFLPRISDDVDALWEKIDNAPDYTPPKPELLRDASA